MPIQIEVRYFAAAREIAGAQRETYTLDEGATVADVRDALFAAHPRLRPLQLAFAVNAAYATPETPLHAGDEVACIPPVGGG
jgi:molybdopterin converting factor subunit 1